MLRSDGEVVTQDWAKRLEGKLQTKAAEFICHSVNTTEHWAPACTATSAGILHVPERKVLGDATKCPRAGALKLIFGPLLDRSS